MVDNERPSDSVRNCSCNCHDNGIGEKGGTVHILGSFDNSIDLYVSTPPHTKWVFVDEVEEEVREKYYEKLRKENQVLCG
jgi:hypothetical protein